MWLQGQGAGTGASARQVQGPGHRQPCLTVRISLLARLALGTAKRSPFFTKEETMPAWLLGVVSVILPCIAADEHGAWGLVHVQVLLRAVDGVWARSWVCSLQSAR